MRRQPKKSRPFVGGRLWPRRDYYDEFLPRDHPGAHPVDLLVARTPAARRLNREVKRLEMAVEARLRNRQDWIEYADARLALNGLREQLAFNLGVEVGIVSGRTAQFARHVVARRMTADERAMRLAARGLILQGNVPIERRLLILLEHVWALAVGSPPRDLEASARRRRGRAT